MNYIIKSSQNQHSSKKKNKYNYGGYSWTTWAPKACFIRRTLVASNAIQTIDNELRYLIYCLNCIRRDQNATYETCCYRFVY